MQRSPFCVQDYLHTPEEWAAFYEAASEAEFPCGWDERDAKV